MANKDDEVISMSILKHVEITPDERNAYLKAANQVLGSDDENFEYEETSLELSEERFQELLSKEQILLTISNKGYGKRTSAYEYRVSGRGGMGVANMALTKKNGGEVVATFPVTDDHQIMLVTNKGKLIRTPVENIRTTGRSAQGVTVFKVDNDENVVSVAWLIQEDGEDEPIDADGVEGVEGVEGAVSDEVIAEEAEAVNDAGDDGGEA